MMFLNFHVTAGSQCHVNFCVGPFILIQHPAKFWGHGPCECGYIPFFVCYVTICLMCYMTCHYPGKFRVHRPYGSGHGVCNISSYSYSNFNADVLMSRFTNGLEHKLRFFV